jgi:Spy/CpxP family protein refolding chaperone
MKLTGTKKIIGGIAIALALAVTGMVGFAQQKSSQDGGKARAERHAEGEGHRGGHGMRGGFMGDRFAEKLNLTDAQNEQMKQIKERFHESTKALRDEARGNREDMFAMLNGGTFDEAAVRAAAQEQANKHVEMEVSRARMMSEIFAILTPEQKAQLAAERQQMEQKRQQWRSGHGEGSDENQ